MQEGAASLVAPRSPRVALQADYLACRNTLFVLLSPDVTLTVYFGLHIQRQGIDG